MSDKDHETAAIALYGVLFAHWRDCNKPACRRAKACRGEAVQCFRRWWRGLPEEKREEGRALIRGLVEARAQVETAS